MQQELNSSWCPGSVCSSFTSNHVRIWRAKLPFWWAEEAQAGTCQQCHTQLSPPVAVVFTLLMTAWEQQRNLISQHQIYSWSGPLWQGRALCLFKLIKNPRAISMGKKKKKSSLIERYWKWTHKLLWVSGEQSTWRIWFSAASPFFFP